MMRTILIENTWKRDLKPYSKIPNNVLYPCILNYFLVKETGSPLYQT